MRRLVKESLLHMVGAEILVLVAALSPTLAKAGVVIEQRISVGNGGEPSSVRSRTLLLQDDKEKFQITNGMTLIIDANDRTVMLLDDKDKIFNELPLRRVIGTTLDPNRDLYEAFKNSNRKRQLLGFKCQDYTGERDNGPLLSATTACFSTDATGSDDFDHFIKMIVRAGRG